MARSRRLRNVLLFLALILIALYAIFESRGLITGPRITIDTPISGTTITTQPTVIEGTATNISSITLNDRAIFISETGQIEESIVLLPGYNEMTLKGKDRFGKETVVVLELLYAPSDAPPLPALPASTSTPSSQNATSS